MPKGAPKMNQVAPDIVVSPTPSEGLDPTPSIVTRVEPNNLLKPPRSSAGADSAISSHSTRSSHTVDVERREKLDLMKISQDRKDYLSAIRPVHSKAISGWTSKGYYASSISGCPPGMEPTVNLRELFISRAGNRFGALYDNEQDLGPAKYQIFSPDGQIHFFGVETLQADASYPFRVRDVDLTVTGAKGGIVFQIMGTNKVKNDDKILGTITRYGLRPQLQPSYKFWSYKIRDADGTEVCRFDRRKDEGKYVLYFPGVKESFGEGKENWDKSEYRLPPSPDSENIFGVDLRDYGKKFNPLQKTLILAATIFIYDNYAREEHFGPNKTRFKWGLFYNLVIGAIILILTIVIIGVTNSGKSTKKAIVCPRR